MGRTGGGGEAEEHNATHAVIPGGRHATLITLSTLCTHMRQHEGHTATANQTDTTDQPSVSTVFRLIFTNNISHFLHLQNTCYHHNRPLCIFTIVPYCLASPPVGFSSFTFLFKFSRVLLDAPRDSPFM